MNYRHRQKEPGYNGQTTISPENSLRDEGRSDFLKSLRPTPIPRTTIDPKEIAQNAIESAKPDPNSPYAHQQKRHHQRMHIVTDYKKAGQMVAARRK
tara:strand:+ start:5419 stop:5709 length:291 start_codon:yes stop_codon:yes gene_type:complete